MSDIRFVYFGGEPLGVPVLEELKASGLLPELIVCNPDRPVGRKQELTPPPVKEWAQENGIEVFQPTSYKDESVKERIMNEEWDLFVVVAYNFILPKWLLEIPENGVLNVHPSLLPRLRGASPIRTAIKDDLRDEVGVTVMLMDEEMDHGPILEQMMMDISDENWPVAGPDLDEALARMGGALLADTIPNWVEGNIEPQEQPHELASYCGKLKKEDSELNLDPHNLPTGNEAKQAWHIHQAFLGIGNTFFVHNDKRVKITEAEYKNNVFQLVTVVPEGKSAIPFELYLQSIS